MKKRIHIIIISLVLSLLCLSSCDLSEGLLSVGLQDLLSDPVESSEQTSSDAGDKATESEVKGSTDDEKTESTTIIEQTINQDITNNQITIEGESIDVSYAVTSGLRSVVSVYSVFTTTYPQQSYSSAGSGVIYKLTSDGSAFIITNYHVVYDSESSTKNGISSDISLFLYGMEMSGKEISASYVGGSMNYDIAILYVDKSEILADAANRGSICAAELAQDTIAVGETVIAVGNPEAEGISATTGVVSVDSEYITMTGADDVTQVEFRVIRTDTAINSGNSGGGLFNAKGELVGIVNAKIMSNTVENIGYAIPVEVARSISENIIDYCFEQECETVMRPLLGVSVLVTEMWTEYDPDLGTLNKLEQSEIVSITEGSLADGSFEVGDIVKSITIGEKTIEITRQYQIIDFILNARVGDTVSTVVIRNVDGVDTEVTVDVVITEASLSAYA